MKRGLPLMGSLTTPPTDEATRCALPSPGSLPSPSPDIERPRKVRRQDSFVKSVLRSLTNSHSNNSTGEATTWPKATAPARAEKAPQKERIMKKLSMPFLWKSFGASLHRKPSKPGLTPLTPPSGEKNGQAGSATTTTPGSSKSPAESNKSNGNGNSTSTSNATSSGKSSGHTHITNTTAKTSLDSKLSAGRDNDSIDKKSATIIRPERPECAAGGAAVPDLSLTTIQETALDLVSPTILTVEKAAAAKIYLEVYFNERLGLNGRPTPRSLRRRRLEAELYHNGSGLTPKQKDACRRALYRQETEHLRATRALKAKSLVSTVTPNPNPTAAAHHRHHHPLLADNYEVLKIIGKGSFGVVRLVREKASPDPDPDPDHNATTSGRKRQVYAMKVIRKSTMLRTSQEGHLRAERDFLVASEGSRWVVPLVASFQDAVNLYLVMEYMPGGDFLGLLIRENILTEPVARFYAAEMVLCIEEAHSLRCIHRDVKPDNFLVAASGHLMISDFGLAFDGNWSHDTAYYHTHRYSLLHRLGVAAEIEGDAQDRAKGALGNARWTQGLATAMRRHERSPPAIVGGRTFTPSSEGGGIRGAENKGTDEAYQEPLLNWRNRHGNRAAAQSCVGTSQYMAPEVVREGDYDARCDWWSFGVILYECLYGHTPFLPGKNGGGRQATKRNILNHRHTFAFPPRPAVSRRAMDLMASLICDQDNRLCDRRYRRGNGNGPGNSPGNSSGKGGGNGKGSAHQRAWAGGAGAGDRPRVRAVYPYDAGEIKNHKWFRDVPWSHLHTLPPPFVPMIAGAEDTRYFEDEESISDWSESRESLLDGKAGGDGDGEGDGQDGGAGPVGYVDGRTVVGCQCSGFPYSHYPHLSPHYHHQFQHPSHNAYPPYHLSPSGLPLSYPTSPVSLSVNGSAPLTPQPLPPGLDGVATNHTNTTTNNNNNGNGNGNGALVGTSSSPRKSFTPAKAAAMQAELARFPPHARAALARLVGMVAGVGAPGQLPPEAATAAARLNYADLEIEALVSGTGHTEEEARQRMRAFVRAYGTRGGGGGGGGGGVKKVAAAAAGARDRKRPRDRILRDQRTRRLALEVRKRSAFLGYSYRRFGGWEQPSSSHHPDGDDLRADRGRGQGRGQYRDAGPAFGGGGGGGGGEFGAPPLSPPRSASSGGDGYGDGYGDGDGDGERADAAAYRAWCGGGGAPGFC